MSDPSENPFVEMFDNPELAANYADGPAMFVPGFADIHRMTMVLLRERVGASADILVHGAGGGLELEAFARANPDWRFVGVDPAQAMIDEAEKRLAEASRRVQFHCGLINDAPAGPFDGATSLLTLHFLAADQRRQTVRAIVDRLKPGAPFIAVHCSFPQTEPARAAWLQRYREFAISAGAPPEMAETARQSVDDSIALLEPELDMQILREAGLQDVTSFYSAFTWRGWVGYAA